MRERQGGASDHLKVLEKCFSHNCGDRLQYARLLKVAERNGLGGR